MLFWSRNRVNLDWVGVIKRIDWLGVVTDEWSVFTWGLWVLWVLVLMVDAGVDDFIVNHSCKILKTVELDGLVGNGGIVKDYWVGTFTASAGGS